MDKSQSHFTRSIFYKLNPLYWGPESWSSKYVNNDYTKGRKKWKGIVIPVIFTDWWHLAKTLMNLFHSIGAIFILLSSSFLLTLSLYQLVLIFILYFWIFGLGFTIGWDYLLDRNFLIYRKLNMFK